MDGTADGISLLNLKSLLFCDYLLHLSYYTLTRLRSLPLSQSAGLLDALIDLRVDLDRGVRPLEQKLRYQIDKVIRASERSELQQQTAGDDALQYAPRLDDLAQSDDEAAGGADGSDDGGDRKGNGIYRPPRIAATLPTEEAQARRDKRRPNATLREFADSELSNAPMAEPSIGSNITSVRNGRRTTAAVESARDRRDRDDVRRYEEENYTRLPTTGKDKKRRGGREDTYGGEDFRMLDAGLYDDLASRAGTGRGSALSRSRKRQTDDGGDANGAAGNGPRIGETFKRRKGALKSRRSTYK